MRALFIDSWKRRMGTEAGAPPGEASALRVRRRWSSGKVLKVVRRIHLYAGLIMLPWILLYGVSGLLFNHPNLGEEVRSQRLAAPLMQELTGLSPWRPQQVASQVITELNAQAAGGPRYQLDLSYESQFSGVGLLNAPAPDGLHLLLVDVERGAGILATRSARPRADAVPFDGARVPLSEYSMQAIEAGAQGLLASRELQAQEELRAHPKIAPLLRFRMTDDAGTAYNVTYHVGSGELSGRRASEWSPIGATQLLTTLHTTHHFTSTIGPLWFWALFQDLLGLTMAFWAISGMFMWWQMKPTRIVGAVSLLLALGVAGAVMWSTTDYLMFGNVAEKLGPGG